MSETKAQRLAQALNDFINASHDVEAAAIVSFDGLTIASALPDDLDEERLGAMSAALLSLGEQAAAGLGRGELGQIFVEGAHGFVFLMSAKDQAVLVTVASNHAKIGFMLFEMRRAAETIGILLEEQPADPYLDELARAEAVAVAPEAPRQVVAPVGSQLPPTPEVGEWPAAPEPMNGHRGAAPEAPEAPAPIDPSLPPWELMGTR